MRNEQLKALEDIALLAPYKRADVEPDNPEADALTGGSNGADWTYDEEAP
jgi:hypothetical protein